MHDLADVQKKPTEDTRADIASRGEGGWRVAVGPTEELGYHRALKLVAAAVDTKSKGCRNEEHLEVRRVPSSEDGARVASDCAEELDRAAEATTLQGLILAEGLVVMLRQCTDFLEEAES
jgi:hypothetical protein